jgi:hypothetical protein
LDRVRSVAQSHEVQDVDQLQDILCANAVAVCCVLGVFPEERDRFVSATRSTVQKATFQSAEDADAPNAFCLQRCRDAARRLTYQSGVWSTIGALACPECRNGMKRVLHIAQLAICFAGVLTTPLFAQSSGGGSSGSGSSGTGSTGTGTGTSGTSGSTSTSGSTTGTSGSGTGTASGSTGTSTGQPENDKDRPAGEPKGSTDPKASK